MNDDDTIPGWLVRLKTERAELNLRLVKLTAFVNSADLLKLHPREQARLLRQEQVMQEYLFILDQRIREAGENQ